MDMIINNVIVTHEIHEKSRNYFPDKLTKQNVHIQVLDDVQNLQECPV
jgi:hypothetical protein